MSSKLQKNSNSTTVGYDHLLKLLVIGDSGKKEWMNEWIVLINRSIDQS